MKIFRWSRLILWCALIFYLSSIPNLKTELGGWDFVLRKIAHALEYGILYVLAFPLFGRGYEGEKSGFLRYLPALVFSIMYAMSDEIHQHFVVGRFCAPLDVAIDSAGAVVAMILKMRDTGKIFDTRHSAHPRSAVFLLFVFAGLLMSGCSGYEVARLKRLEAAGKFIDAAVGFERFALKNPSSRLAPYALLDAARIYNYELRLPAKSSSIYRKIEQDYASRPDIVAKAREGLLRSPDYMPLADGARWVEGDSASGGSNMKAVWTAKEVSTGSFILEKRYTAGTDSRSVALKKVFYVFDGYSLVEKQALSSPDGRIFLEYPIYHGKEWKYGELALRIEFVPGVVEVKAGKFAECIRIAERTTSGSVTKYNYYAPYVGWILTTVATSAGGEHRNSELISYEFPQNKKKK